MCEHIDVYSAISMLPTGFNTYAYTYTSTYKHFYTLLYTLIHFDIYIYRGTSVPDIARVYVRECLVLSLPVLLSSPLQLAHQLIARLAFASKNNVEVKVP